MSEDEPITLTFRRPWIVPALCALPLALACGKPEIAAKPIRTSELPARVDVSANSVTVGVQTGTIRFDRVLRAFSISTSPITVGEYKKCVAAGVCGKPALQAGACSTSTHGNDGNTYDADPPVLDAPVTCVGIAQAQGYCDWVGGGRLPTSEEWALAARGSSVARYAWGVGSPSCERHVRVAFGPAEATCCNSECEAVPQPVGQHPAGASPFKLSDVLLTRGELIGASVDAGWASCKAPYVGCVAHGNDPGAIDAFTAMGTPNQPDADTTEIVAAFRCVWEGAS